MESDPNTAQRISKSAPRRSAAQIQTDLGLLADRSAPGGVGLAPLEDLTQAAAAAKANVLIVQAAFTAAG